MTAYGSECFTMNEVNRLKVIQRVHDHTLLQREAARLLEQVQRVLRRYREHGAASVVSVRREHPGNNRIPDDLRCAALHLNRQPCLVSGSRAEVLPD
ncbi:hypothetical protein ACCY16_22935 [Candidatus Pantoea formicae]|uniref:hypothetical protein n=1 Tax=Candidatus Pantoea formicae TaxID=2608355 RepID=UPI003EDA2044